MKKVLAISLVLCGLFVFTGCDNTMDQQSDRIDCLNEGGAWNNGKCEMYE